MLQRIRVKWAGSRGPVGVGDSAGIDGADADQSVSSPSHSMQPSAVAGMSDAGMSDAGMSDAGMSTVEYVNGRLCNPYHVTVAW